MIIILHHTPAALLQAEKNLIHLNAGLSLLGHFLGLFVQCLGSLCTFYFIYKIVSVQYIIQIYAEQHSRCESLNERRSHLSYCMMKSDALHIINDYIYKDTEHKFFGC